MDSDKNNESGVTPPKDVESNALTDTSSRTGSDGSVPPEYDACAPQAHDNPALEVSTDAESCVDTIAVVINGVEDVKGSEEGE